MTLWSGVRYVNLEAVDNSRGETDVRERSWENTVQAKFSEHNLYEVECIELVRC
jgi:hypothetical protein